MIHDPDVEDVDHGDGAEDIIQHSVQLPGPICKSVYTMCCDLCNGALIPFETAVLVYV